MKIKAKMFNTTFYAVLSVVLGVMLLVASFFIGGCARFQAGDISYLRIGNQTIDCKITTHPDGTREVEFKQNSKTEAMKVLVDAAAAYANK